MSTVMVDSVSMSNFDSNVEIAQRKYDGKWNLWVKELFLSNAPEDMSWNWTVVDVFDTEFEAKKGLENFRKLVRETKK